MVKKKPSLLDPIPENSEEQFMKAMDSMDSTEPPEEGTLIEQGELKSEGIGSERQAFVEALETVFDPEIPVNIYALGLIYKLSVDAYGNVSVVMTLTTPMCPVAGILPYQVASALQNVEGAGHIRVLITWDPPWSLDMMSEDARIALNMT